MKKLNFIRKLNINVLDGILILFAVLFVYAAISKLLTYDEFKVQISKSPLIMNHAWWIVWFIPSIELIIAVILFIPRLQLLGLYGAFALMFIFTIYIVFMLAFTPDLPCSCGGILNSMGWKSHLIFNIVFTALAILGIVQHNKAKRMEPIAV